MERFITTEQVAKLAFAPTDFITPDNIPKSAITAAQAKYLVPLFGAETIEQIFADNNKTLAEEYLAPALALFVKADILPQLAVTCGAMGVVGAPRSSSFAEADEASLRRVARAIRREARTLLRVVVDEVESNLDKYSDYDPHTNVAHRCSIEGEIVLTRFAVRE